MPHVDRERDLEYKRAWRRSNKDRNAAAARAYRARHPERVKASNKRYAEKNAEKVQALKAAWRERNPERVKANERRSRKRREERMRKDVEYMMRRVAYQRAYWQRKRKTVQTGFPSWLGGMLPSVSGQARVHLVTVDD